MTPPTRDTDAPPITIGVTCYNAEATIGRALESASAQDWPHLDILVVDDCSTDGSRAVVRAHARRDPRIRLVEHACNQGCATARNTIVQEARGIFLAFFDDDDVSRPDRLRLQAAQIAAHERNTGAELVACYASGQRRYPNGYVMPFDAVGSRPRVPVGTEMVDFLLSARRKPGIFYGGGTPTCSLMARTAVFHKVGPFDATLRRQEDVDFAVRLGFLGGHFIGIEEPVLTQYFSHGNEKSAEHEHCSFLRLLEKNHDYLARNGDYAYMRGWAEVRFRHFSGRPVAAALALMPLLLRSPARLSKHFLRSASRRFLHERRMKD